MSDQRQQRRADGLAVVVAIALDELARDDKIWPHTRALLASALAAYAAGKAELEITPEDAARQAAGALRIAKQFDDFKEE